MNEQKNRQVTMLPLTDIVPGDNPRQDFDEVAMSELMQSMKHNGLLTPVGVRTLPTGKKKLVFGHRRFIAASKLGWDKIETILIDVNDEKDALIKTSTENVIRENVSMPEQGRIFTTLLKKGLNAEQIAVRMGCSKRFVLNSLEAFNQIPKQFHDKITYGTRGQVDKKGSIPATVALAAVNVRKESGLTENQVGQLMTWAAKTDANVVKMRAAGKMISDGVKPEKAMEEVEFMKTITLSVTMKIAVIKKLQQKYDMKIHAILYKFLEGRDEFKITLTHKDMPEHTPQELVPKRTKRYRNR